MASSILYFDIGNTSCKIGIARGQSRPIPYVLPTDHTQTADQFGLHLLQILHHAEVIPAEITACIASSVVPNMNSIVRHACERYVRQPLLFTPDDLPVPLENRYALPHEVGADRLVGAFAARRLFPNSPAIISVDFGTATTFDCVQGNAYLGGLICPGVLSSAAALATKTARLPRVNLELDEVRLIPGRSTATSLSHGFVFGFAAMAEGLCSRLAADLTGPVSIVGTGGFATSIAKVSPCFHAVRPDLLLEGLHLLYIEHTENQTANCTKELL